MTWVSRNVSVQNNVLSEGGPRCLVCVVDQTRSYRPQELKPRFDGNYYQQLVPEDPTVVAVWPSGTIRKLSYSDVDSYRAGTGQDRHSVFALGGDPVVGPDGGLAPAVTDVAAQVARPLNPPSLAAVGNAPEPLPLGAWTR
jgi:hypothetical protein